MYTTCKPSTVQVKFDLHSVGRVFMEDDDLDVSDVKLACHVQPAGTGAKAERRPQELKLLTAAHIQLHHIPAKH